MENADAEKKNNVILSGKSVLFMVNVFFQHDSFCSSSSEIFLLIGFSWDVVFSAEKENKEYCFDSFYVKKKVVKHTRGVRYFDRYGLWTVFTFLCFCRTNKSQNHAEIFSIVLFLLYSKFSNLVNENFVLRSFFIGVFHIEKIIWKCFAAVCFCLLVVYFIFSRWRKL